MMTAEISDRPIRVLCVVLVTLAVADVATRVLRADSLAQIGDFFALWTYPVVARLHGAAALYDLRSLYEAQVALGMPRDAFNPFPYPPTFLLIQWPLGALPFTWASGVWMLTTLALYLVAVGWDAPNWRLTVLLAAVVPSSVMTLTFGQSGFLSAALIIGGFRLAWTRPWLGGVLLGLLSYKPQLGLLVPVALASAGLWSCLLATALTFAALILVTSAAFGWTIWLIWLKALPAHLHLYALGENIRISDVLSPTVTANLQLVDAPGWLIASAQLVAALGAAAVVWWSFRHRSRSAALLTLCAATFLATPHAVFYDLTMLGGAIVLYQAHHREDVDALSIGQKITLLAALWLPFVVDSDLRVPVSSAILLGVIWVACREPPGRLEDHDAARPLSHRPGLRLALARGRKPWLKRV